jgi:hypothetical protein
MILSCWHFGQVTASDRTPLARMLPSDIGSPAGDLGLLPMPGGYRVAGAVEKLQDRDTPFSRVFSTVENLGSWRPFR